MKTMFAALASALLVSTAFAQTAAPAPAPSTSATMAAHAGKADLKAGTEAQPGATKTTAGKASGEAGVKKIPAAHAKAKAHKVSKKTQAVKAGAGKAKTDAGNEANAAAAKTDATVKTQ
ncbi:hypothetical protein [Paraburkholderia hospita]|uniref:TolA protein n=1 Tax=Paraburkholderia hospita TaxID=169430 RepID=A0AAN1JMT5_9BURK|nr:hypothetical protein [Paraburkholderia hospita]AUT76786.1 hypothetical protein C2L64_51745 [Paraburkholderia hospita]SEI28530.1 hypothetical protein SAMN05192544_113613 [Paraburkholderia hospita]